MNSPWSGEFHWIEKRQEFAVSLRVQTQRQPSQAVYREGSS